MLRQKTLLIDSKDYAAAKRIARRTEGDSTSRIIRTALREFIARDGSKPKVIAS